MKVFSHSMVNKCKKLTGDEYRRLQRLKSMGIQIGSAVDPPQELERLTFEQIDDGMATVYELLIGGVAVVVPAKMIVRKAGILITDGAITLALDDFPLDLSDPRGSSYYQDLIKNSISYPPTILNDWLMRKLPLRPRQETGILIAVGHGRVPPRCHENSRVALNLLLRDERDNELRFEFEGRLDRSLKRKYELNVRRGSRRIPIFKSEDRQVRDQETVVPLTDSRTLAVRMTKPDTETRGGTKGDPVSSAQELTSAYILRYFNDASSGRATASTSRLL